MRSCAVVIVLGLMMPVWAAADEELRCFRCEGLHGERVFGECAPGVGIPVEVPCTPEKVARHAMEKRQREQEQLRRQEEEARAARLAEALKPRRLGVNLDGYNALRMGMSYQDVVTILGSSGIEVTRSELGDLTTVMYEWYARNGLGNMNAMFQNDRLVSKTQFGLD